MTNPKPFGRVWLWFSAVVLVLAACAAGAAAAVIQHYSRDLPSVASLRDLHLSVPLRIYSRDKQLIGEFGAERRALLSYQQIPPQLVQAFVAVEDERFFSHPGVDWQGLLRAGAKLATSGEKSQGGSTITMQLARNVFLSSERTYTRKLREILLSLKIERELSKQEILELYLNKIFLGERAYGVGAAALVYFGKDVRELSLGQWATIAGLPKAPSRDNPAVNPARATERRNYVLRRMAEVGAISPAQMRAAQAEPMEVHPYQAQVDVDAHYVAEMVRAELIQRYGEEVYSQGMSVVTSIDANKQRAANAALRKGLLDYDRRHGWRGAESALDAALLKDPQALTAQLRKIPVVGDLEPAVVVQLTPEALRLMTRAGARTLPKAGFEWARLSADKPSLKPGDVVRLQAVGEGFRLAQIPLVQGALVALDADDGGIEALVGGFDFFAAKFNRATQARRQAGSSFKPFLYAAAMTKGFSPASVVLDAPIVLQDGLLESTWKPQNYGGDLKGPMRLREALVQSRNLVSIRLLQAIGIQTALREIPRFGLPAERLPRDLTLSLGSAVYTPLEMARGYATFANGGFVVEPWLIAEVRDAQGKLLDRADPARACPQCSDDSEAESTPQNTAPRAPQAVDPKVVWLVSDMMHDVATRGTAARVRELQRNDLAGKTGTSNDENDAWFVGFQRHQAVASWVGFDQPAPLGRGEVGGRTALPIWIDYMRTALKGVKQERLPRPPGLTEVRINRKTGKLAAAGDADAIFETVQQDNIPEAETQADGDTPGESSNPLQDLF